MVFTRVSEPLALSMVLPNWAHTRTTPRAATATAPGIEMRFCKLNPDHVEEREILGAVQSADDWPEKLRRLVGNALENGGQDNITAMYAVFEEAGDR